MYVTETSDTEKSLCIERILEDIPGGGIVDPDDFKTTTTKMGVGAPLGVDANGIYHVFKTAELYENETNSETDYKVLKGHEFKVGDFIADSALAGASEAITDIDTDSSEDYDVITVGTTIGHAMTAGECLVQATDQQSAGSATYKNTLKGLALNSVDLTLDNMGCGILRRGTVNESLLPYPLDTTIKGLLRSEIANILFI